MAFTDIVGLMEQADATIQTVGEMSDDGMGLVFEANVFGHYIMVNIYILLLSLFMIG
jgi:17beta-estradiol 17-dehydrogenase/3beta-hydroxysteroid 3-dehydrogenase